MAPAGGGAENGVGGIFPCWNAAATLGGKRKKKKRKERIPGKKKTVTRPRKRRVTRPCHAPRSRHAACAAVPTPDTSLAPGEHLRLLETIIVTAGTRELLRGCHTPGQGGWMGGWERKINQPRRGIRSVPPGHAVLEWQRGEGWGGARSRKRGARKGRNSTGIDWKEGKRWGNWEHHKENGQRAIERG